MRRIFVFLLFAVLYASCEMPDSTAPETKKDKKAKFIPDTSPPISQAYFGEAGSVAVYIQDDFETGDFAKYAWEKNNKVTIVDASSEWPEAAENKIVKMPASSDVARLEITVNYPEPSALTFRCKTDIKNSTTTKQSFKVYVNGAEKGSVEGLDADWRQETVVFAAGTSTLLFEVTGSNYYWTNNSKNAVYLDDIGIVTDATDTVIAYPSANQETYMNVPDYEKVVVSGAALRVNGTVRTSIDMPQITFSGAGVDSSTGVITPAGTGSFTATASHAGKNGSSGVISVYSADYMREPYTYPGTGITYSGYVSGGSGSNVPSSGAVIISYPDKTNFSADGFFTLEGTVNKSSVKDYCYIIVEKGSLSTTYLAQGSFKTRIWLRYGAGNYTVKVYELINFNAAPAGAPLIWSWGSPNVTFNVTNTRNEHSLSDIADRRFIYPSEYVQSDNFLITNHAAEITYGLTDPTDKARAIHDWIIKNTVYDHDSLNDRKKQDAMTVLKTRYHADSQYEPKGHFKAVCEGYANTMVAMLRAVGMEANYSGSNYMSHAWNSVYIDDAWKFMDVTWDDPTTGDNTDLGPMYASTSYFLLSSPNGIEDDHTDGVVDQTRSITNVFWH
ncbi:hypothetical protein AGMMS50212_02360 [Spirochaetia bacterium]|nr:hypothetical protein AGMMS50212_02360 [Spirochaetia bacterium]